MTRHSADYLLLTSITPILADGRINNMTLREWLELNRGEHCYYAFPICIPDPDVEDKPKYIRIAEVWRIPTVLLNKEIEVK